MRKTFVINLDRCSGCDSCVTACKYANDLPLGEFYNSVVSVERGVFPEVAQYWLPMFCQECDNPQCVEVCPTGASHVDPDTGVVLIDQDACIGCQLCISACPYGARSMHQQANVAQKCIMCGVSDKDSETEEGTPVCVHNCPCGARLFGDIDDPESRVSRELAKYGQECIHTISDRDATGPSVRYILSPRIAAWVEES